MAQIICDKLDCPFRDESRICQKEFTVINQFGLCDNWYDKNGVPRLRPLHLLQQECDEYFANRTEKIEDDSNRTDKGKDSTE